jgi:hypothetical protein
VIDAGALTGGGPLLESITVSGKIAVGGAPTHSHTGLPGAAYVFEKAAGGWASEDSVAELLPTDSASGDDFGTQIAVSGSTVIVLSGGPGKPGYPPSPGAVYVFSQPPGGWSGLVHQSAKLVSSDPGCGLLASIAISGPTVAISCVSQDSVDNHEPVLVFTEPAGGWSGTLTQSATLEASSGQELGGGAVAMSGQTIFVAGTDSTQTGHVYAFRAPAGGWKGTVSASANLSTTSPVPAVALDFSDGTLFAGDSSGTYDQGHYVGSDASVWAFRAPRRGWSGKISPVARLVYPSNATQSGPSLSASGRTVTVGHEDVPDDIVSCPCTSDLDVFREPNQGWTGRIAPQINKLVTNPELIPSTAVQDPFIFMTDGSSIRLLKDTAGIAPAASRIRVAGLRTDRPGVSIELKARSDAPAMREVSLVLPAGLQFSRERARVLRGLTFSGRHTVSVSKSRLTVQAARATTVIRLGVRSPAMVESQGLSRRARAHRAMVIVFSLQVTDANGETSKVIVRRSVG